MSPFTTTLIEWGSTLLSLVGFWLCIRHRSSCFVVFLVADIGWFGSAWVNAHNSLLAQQAVYILLNIVGYVMWRRDERLKEQLDRIEARALAPDSGVASVVAVAGSATDKRVSASEKSCHPEQAALVAAQSKDL